jgi:uncharacterized protein YbbK (DUF523 family)/uncharacterized protein YbgA (DUF1722 family)
LLPHLRLSSGGVVRRISSARIVRLILANQKLSGEDPIRIGVSACLLGHQVRYDGGHKRDRFVTEALGRFVEFVPVCPEVELGLGVPREALELERRGADVQLIAFESRTDHTAVMRQYAERRLDALKAENLCGYVLKKNSPSCGMEGIPVAGQQRSGRGLFADALIRRWPNLPVEEEGRLNDVRIRGNFIERVFAYCRLRRVLASRWTPAGLHPFHAAHELQLQAHSATAYDELARLIVAQTGRVELGCRYEDGFMQALAQVATPARHTRVLRRAAEYLHPYLTPEARDELAQAIADYRRGIVPLIVPIGLVQKAAQRFDIDYIKSQTYLKPYPTELTEPAG